MSFAATETQTMLADMLRRLLAENYDFEKRRRALAVQATHGPALWPLLAENGVLGAALPEEAGGFGGTTRDLAVVMREAGARLLAEPLLESAIVARLLLAGGAHAELAQLIAGARSFTFAHTESGDPFAVPNMRADAARGDVRLTGTKTLVRHATHARGFVVSARHDGTGCCYLVDAGAAGLTLEPFRLIDGTIAATLRFSNTPARFLASEAALSDTLIWYSLGLAAEACGIMQACNDATFAYLGTRKQFGVKLSSFQALQHRAANMFAASEEARALTLRAITAYDSQSAAAPALASAAKALADDSGHIVGHDGVQLHGGMGVSDELDISHFMRRLTAIRAENGTADRHRMRFAELQTQVNIIDDSGELTAFRAEVRDFVRHHLPPDIGAKSRLGLELDKSDFVRWQKILREKSWFGAAWPRAHGGAGWDLQRQLTFLQEAALNDAPMIIPYGVNMVGPVLQHFGSPEQQARHLPGILSSDVWWCQGYSEPNAGSDLASLKTTAIRDGDHYVVNGTKMWTTEAHWADWMHCLVRTDRDVKPQRGISFLLIDMTTPGIDIRPIVTIDGQHHTNQIFLDNVRVPAENLVGGEGAGWTIAKFLLSHERVAIADTGPKLRLLTRIAQRLAESESAGHLVGTSCDLLRHKYAGAAIQLQALCALEQEYVRHWAAGAVAEGPQASVLKIRGTEILQALSEIAMELEGPFTAAHDPADLHRAANGNFSPAQQASLMAHRYLYGRCWSIFGGTNEIQRNIIARSVLKE